MKAGDVLMALAIMVIFGCTFPVVKIGLGAFPPLFLLFLRFSLVALLLVPFAPVPRGRLRGIFLLSITLGGLHFPLMFYGIRGIDAATAAIASQLQVPFASLLAAILFGDLLGWRRLAGMALAFAGVVLIAGEPRLAGSLVALLQVIVASFLFSAAAIQIKLLGAINLFTLNGWMTLFAAPQVLVLSLLLETGQAEAVADAGWSSWLAILYLVVPLTVFAHGNWYRLVHRYAVNQTVPFLLLVPLFGVAAAVVLLGEPITIPLLAGGVLTVAGVAVIVLRKPKQVVTEAASLR